MVILKYRVLWAWLGWLGALIAAAAVVGSAGTIENDPEGVLATVGIIAFIGFGVWILATSVALLQSRDLTAT